MKYKITYTYDLEVIVEAPDKQGALELAGNVDVFADTKRTLGVIYASVDYTDMIDIECMDDEDPPQKERA